MLFTHTHGAILTLAFVVALPLSAQTITTVAGNTSWGTVSQVAIDASGNLYTPDADKAVIYKTDRFGGTTTIAGSGTAGYAGDGGPALSARFNRPTGIAVAPDGTLYVGDTLNSRIRKISPSGTVTTYAGSGTAGFTGDGAQASVARINQPFTLFLDAGGNLFFVDYGNSRIRKIRPDGVIATVAGSGSTRYAGDGGLATAASINPGWIFVATDGTIYLTDDANGGNGNQRVRKVSPNGVISTVAGTGVLGYGGDGGPAAAAIFNTTAGVAADSSGNVFISDADNARIRKVAPNGIISTYAGTGKGGFAGDGGPAANAQLARPTGITIDTNGDLYFLDQAGNRVRRISAPLTPVISSTDAAVPSFLGKAGFGSNTYVEIYGSNLSATSRIWGGGDFNGSNAPTSIDGVSVTVNGKAAFVYFVSPGQVNIVTPDDTVTGPVQIQVRNSLGSSNAGLATRARISPTLQAIPQFNIGGKQYVVAQTPDFKSFIGVPGMLAGVAFVRAKPGDTVSLFALGCGPTNPPTPSGLVAPLSAPLALPFQVKIAGVSADIQFGGSVSGTVGLYQINVVVPNVAAGDRSIELVIDGIANAQNLVITIGG